MIQGAPKCAKSCLVKAIPWDFRIGSVQPVADKPRGDLHCGTCGTCVERREAFVASALKAEQEVAQYGLVYDADEVFSYIKARVQGRRRKQPAPRKL